MPLYLDIETAPNGRIAVLGYYERSIGLVQVIHPHLDELDLLAALPRTRHLVTFNGHSFDLPIIRKQLGVDLREHYESIDLRWACQRLGWKGGLKQVEQRLGIRRESAGIHGWDAVGLWQRYWYDDDKAALELLLTYNREDVRNLIKVRSALRRERACP